MPKTVDDGVAERAGERNIDSISPSQYTSKSGDASTPLIGGWTGRTTASKPNSAFAAGPWRRWACDLEPGRDRA